MILCPPTSTLFPYTTLFRSNGTIGLIDFGMVGVLDERTQELLPDLLIAINQQNADRLVDVFLELGVTRKRIDRKSTRLNSSHGYISYAVFCLKKKSTGAQTT